MKKQFWGDGSPITVYVLGGDHPLHRDFSKKRLSVFPSQLQSIWYRQVYTGTGRAPQTLQSVDEMIERITHTTGAIGYLYNKNIEKMNNNENIQILTIH